MALWRVQHVTGADGKVIIERLFISLPYIETFNSKVIKYFVPELRSRYVFFVLRDSYVLCDLCALWKLYVHFTYPYLVMVHNDLPIAEGRLAWFTTFLKLSEQCEIQPQSGFEIELLYPFPTMITVTLLYTSFGGARGVMVIVVGNGHGDTSSNPQRDWLHLGKVWIQLFLLQLWVNSRTYLVLQLWWGN